MVHTKTLHLGRRGRVAEFSFAPLTAVGARAWDASPVRYACRSFHPGRTWTIMLVSTFFGSILVNTISPPRTCGDLTRMTGLAIVTGAAPYRSSSSTTTGSIFARTVCVAPAALPGTDILTQSPSRNCVSSSASRRSRRRSSSRRAASSLASLIAALSSPPTAPGTHGFELRFPKSPRPPPPHPLVAAPASAPACSASSSRARRSMARSVNACRSVSSRSKTTMSCLCSRGSSATAGALG
mmetsp:Transcript_8203/g.33646  ORF Transcript_8203/g.33646 Transcript_8203/m.33646 type:complete len:240 (-) Transcript_8203:1088-1807(-)